MSIKNWLRTRRIKKVLSFNKSKHLKLPDNMYGHVFVFGSNLKGAHNGGAAAFAREHYDAQNGVAQGPTGNAYAIPTLDGDFKQIPLKYVAGFVNEFKQEATENPNVTYHTTPIGCGIAGFEVYEIAPMFLDSPPNVLLPLEFLEFYLRNYDWYKPLFE